MGKATGFLEYQRQTNDAAAPKERIKHFQEFHPPMNQEARRQQAARCMNCGVPFCQSGVSFGGAVSGCPLHNLIPEWNDEIYNDNWQQALSRLKKTNNLPEFTGRVCPALCEAACTCGMHDGAVTVRENELAIVEEGYAKGWIQPSIPPVRSGKKVAVIGSGPAGLAAADQLNQRGHLVTVFERDQKPGGLLMYGIPNMKLEKEVVLRRIRLMEEEGVTFRTGVDVGRDITPAELQAEFDAVILCCGAKKPRALAAAEGDVQGVYYAVDFLSDMTRDLMGEAVQAPVSAKGKHVVVVGGGDTGNDCVGTCIRQGCKSVCQLEMMPKLPEQRTTDNPWPQWARVLKTDYGQEEAIAVFGSDPRVYQTTVKELVKDESGAVTAVKTVKLQSVTDKKTGCQAMQEVPGSEEELPCDLLLIAAGFVGCEEYVADAFQTARTQHGSLQTPEESYQTGQEGVFAAGDCRRGQSLVVWAIAEGRACAKEVDTYLMGYTNML